MLIPARSIQGRRAPAPPTIAKLGHRPAQERDVHDHARRGRRRGRPLRSVRQRRLDPHGRLRLHVAVDRVRRRRGRRACGLGEQPSPQASNTLRFTPASLAGASYYDADDASNTLVSGAVQQLPGPQRERQACHRAELGARPPCDAEYLFSGKKVVRFGTAHRSGHRIANPKFQFLLARPRTGATVGYCATSYGVGLVPVLRNNAGYNWGFQVSGTNVASVGAGFADEYFRPLALVDGGTGATACYLRDYDSKSVASADVGTATDAGRARATAQLQVQRHDVSDEVRDACGGHLGDRAERGRARHAARVLPPAVGRARAASRIEDRHARHERRGTAAPVPFRAQRRQRPVAPGARLGDERRVDRDARHDRIGW